MADLEHLSARVEACFQRILDEKMVGIPILNRELGVQAEGFHLWEGRPLGIIITPWLMSLMLFPEDTDEWDQGLLGSRQSFSLPARDYAFTLNEFDELGRCYTHSLYSPMFDFTDQGSALAMAKVVLTQIHQPVELSQPSDEERRIDAYMRQQAMFDPEPEPPPKPSKLSENERLSRRELLFGALRADGDGK